MYEYYYLPHLSLISYTAACLLFACVDICRAFQSCTIARTHDKEHDLARHVEFCGRSSFGAIIKAGARISFPISKHLTSHDSMAPDLGSSCEDEPLLPHYSPPSSLPSSPAASTFPGAAPPQRPVPPYSNHSQFYVVTLVMCLIFVYEFADELMVSPRTRLFEAIFCHDFYAAHDPSLISDDGTVPERFCKIDQVQAQVALLKGWQGFFENIPRMYLLKVPSFKRCWPDLRMASPSVGCPFRDAGRQVRAQTILDHECNRDLGPMDMVLHCL